jgi:hypothetical protein
MEVKRKVRRKERRKIRKRKNQNLKVKIRKKLLTAKVPRKVSFCNLINISPIYMH